MKRSLGRLYRRLFVRRLFYGLHKRLFRMAVHGMGIQNSGSFGLSGEAALLKALRAAWGEKRPVVLDVGANEGHYAALVLQHCPQAAVHAFEPHPATFSRLQQRAQALGFTANNRACGSAPGTLTLHDYADREGSGHASLYAGVFNRLHRAPAATHEVGVDTIDNVMEADGIAHVDLLKIDTEGHELAVIDGAAAALAADRIDVVQFEFNEMHVISRVFLGDFQERLPDWQFFRLLPDGLAPLGAYDPVVWELFGDQNIVAVRPGSPLAGRLAARR